MSLLGLWAAPACLTWPASGSAASGGPVASSDPQTTNVPYLGWVGEEIRLEKCFMAPAVTSDNEASVNVSSVGADFLVEGWSGTQQAPSVEQSTVRVYWSSSQDAACAAGDVVALDPGMARVGLAIGDPSGVLGFTGTMPMSGESGTSLWSKTPAYFPKGSGSANATSRIVVAHAQNIVGSPFAGEIVCLSSDGEEMTWFDGTVGGIDLSGTSPASDPEGAGLGRVCVTTDGNRNAVAEVLESRPAVETVVLDRLVAAARFVAGSKLACSHRRARR